MTRHAPNRQIIAVIGALASLGAVLVAPAGAADEAPTSENGLELVVPKSHQMLGTVFHALMGNDAQMTFTSDAPLEFIKGTSNAVVGYAIAGEGGELLAGEFQLSIESIDTGIPMRNKHMQSKRWLEAESFPNIVFRIAETTDITLAKSSDDFSTYDVTLIGDMTIKGITREMSIPATITRMPESDRTKVRFPGDLLAIRCAFPIVLSEFGVGVDDPGITAGKVANDLIIETRLFCSSASPESIRAKRRR